MAKRKGATSERAGSAAATQTRRRAASAPSAPKESLPKVAVSAPQSKPATPKRAQRAPRRAASVEVSLRVAPSNGQPAHARPEPTEAAKATPKPTPPKTRKSSSRRIGDLRDALTNGWEIVQPIFARPLWTAADDSEIAFNFVLRRDHATRLLTIPHSRTVERFISAHQLQVDYRR